MPAPPACAAHLHRDAAPWLPGRCLPLRARLPACVPPACLLTCSPTCLSVSLGSDALDGWECARAEDGSLPLDFARRTGRLSLACSAPCVEQGPAARGPVPLRLPPLPHALCLSHSRFHGVAAPPHSAIAAPLPSCPGPRPV